MGKYIMGSTMTKRLKSTAVVNEEIASLAKLQKQLFYKI